MSSILPRALRTRRSIVWLVAGVALAVLVGAAVVLATSEGAETESDDAAFVWAVGDAADGGPEAAAVANRIAAEGELNRLLYLGDVYEDGTLEEFEINYEPIFGRFASLTEPTPGNHDWPLHAEGYDPYWSAVNGRDQPSYYSFELAGWEVISLNSEEEHGPESPQVEWLRGQLDEPGTCRLAFWHRPRYTAGTTHGDLPGIEPFWEELRGKATLIVNGHDHNMQRLESIDGITTLISGAGGHEHYPLDVEDPRLEFGNATDYGALRMEMRPGSVDFEFIAQDGRTLDSGSVGCDP